MSDHSKPSKAELQAAQTKLESQWARLVERRAWFMAIFRLYVTVVMFLMLYVHSMEQIQVG